MEPQLKTQLTNSNLANCQINTCWSFSLSRIMNDHHPRISFQIIPFVLLLLFASGCDVTDQDNRLEHGIVKIELAQYKFDIPLRYMYGESVEKWRIWRKPKKGRTKVDYIHLSMLLPDLRPYYRKDDARWKVLGHGDRLEVNMSKSEHTWFNFATKNIREYARQNKFYIKREEHYGLTHFSGKNTETYFSSQGVELMMDCTHKTKLRVSPGCIVTSNYQDGLRLEYTYALSYLPHWHEIDTNLKRLFDSFQIKETSHTRKDTP